MPTARSSATGFAGLPCGGRVSSSFGMRLHPILGYYRMHKGIDVACAYGSPVYAVIDGTVAYAGYKGGYGKYIGINGGGGVGTGYGHLSRIAVRIGHARVARRSRRLFGQFGAFDGPASPFRDLSFRRDGQPARLLVLVDGGAQRQRPARIQGEGRRIDGGETGHDALKRRRPVAERRSFATPAADRRRYKSKEPPILRPTALSQMNRRSGETNSHAGRFAPPHGHAETAEADQASLPMWPVRALRQRLESWHAGRLSHPAS